MSLLMREQDGVVFALSPLCCGLVNSYTAAKATPCFWFKAEFPGLSKTHVQPDELEKEPTPECGV